MKSVECRGFMPEVKNKSKEVFESWYSKPAAERSVMSLCLKSVTIFIDVSSRLSTSDFLDDGNRALFTVLSALFDIGVDDFDLTSVASTANDFGVLEAVGGYEYIDALFQSDISESNLNVYVKQILDASLLFKMERSLHKNAEFVHDNGVIPAVEVTSIVSTVEESILSLSLEILKVEDGKQIGTGLKEKLGEYEANPEVIRGLRSGFERLDQATNGFKPGSLSVVAARPKVGKSTLLMNWSSFMCLQESIPILYIDTEMHFDEVQDRFLSHLCGVPERIIKNGLFVNDKRQREAVYAAAEIMHKMPLTHKYMPGFKIEDVKSMVRKYKARHDIGAFFFDYIKAVNLSDNLNETQTLGFLTSALKDLAGILDIPIITAVQLKRDSHGKSYVGSDDVADSDKILRYCNLLMSLTHKTKKEIEEEGIDCGTHRLQILDNRGGSSLYSGIDLTFNQPTLKISESKLQSSGSLIEQSKMQEENNFRR